MVRGAFLVASDTAVAERATGALCGVELVFARVGGESQPGYLEGCNVCSRIAAAGRAVGGTPEQRGDAEKL
jgi:hypothetical protein